MVILCVSPRMGTGEYCGYASTWVRPGMALLVAKTVEILVGMDRLRPIFGICHGYFVFAPEGDDW